MEYIYVIIAVVVAVAGIYCLVNVYKLSSAKVFSGEFIEVDYSEVPETRFDAILDAEKWLENKGFMPLSYVKRSKILQGQDWGAFGIVAYHESLCCVAIALVEPIIHYALESRLYFISIDDRGDIYETLSGSEFPPSCSPPGVHINDAMTLNLEDHWSAHQRFLKDRQVSVTTLDPSIGQLLELCEQVFFKNLVESGTLVSRGDFYSLPIVSVWGIFKRILWVQRTLLAQKRKSSGLLDAEKRAQSENVELQLEAYETHRRIQAGNQNSSSTKTLLLLVSIVLFGASFGFGFDLSLQTLLLLIVVLFIHELGHLCGMWIFGYRDLQMLFVPFLGALASGKKVEIKPWQEAVVLVLGPLPGYLFGIAILFGPEMDIPWLYEFALLSVVLNALNLMPFMPLDGGRLVNLGLFNRLPYLQFIFYLLSIGCFIWAGIVWDEKIFLFLAGLLMFGLVSLFKEIVLLRKLLQAKVHRHALDVLRILQVVSKESIWQRLTPQDRWVALDSLVYRIQHAKSGVLTSGCILVLWMASLILPLYLSLDDEAKANAGLVWSLLIEDDYQPESIEDLETRYTQAGGFDERFLALMALVHRLSNENPDSGTRYWEQLNALSTDSTLTNEQQERVLSTAANWCYLYETQNCVVSFYKQLIDRELRPSIMSGHRVDALLHLAQYGSEVAEARLEYLETVRLGMDILEYPDTKPSIFSRLSKVYYLLGEERIAEEAALASVLSSEKIRSDSTSYYVIELVNFYAHQKRINSAIEVIDKWRVPASDSNPEWIPLSQDFTYIKVWLLAETDILSARETLEHVQVSSVEKVLEVALAKIFLDQAIEGSVGPSAFSNIQSQINLSDEQAQISELAWKLQAPVTRTEGLYGDNGLSFMENRWYANIKKTLENDQLYELKTRIDSFGSGTSG